MRRIAFSGLALALTLGAASLASAQEPTPAPTPAPQAQQQGQRGRAWRQGRRNGIRALFHGVNLTAQQKEQIKGLNQKYAQQARPIRESLRPAMQEMRAARQKGDQTAARAVFERIKPQREQLQQLRQEELKEVRALLTPEQQKTFDRNATQLRQRVRDWRQNRQPRQSQGA